MSSGNDDTTVPETQHDAHVQGCTEADTEASDPTSQNPPLSTPGPSLYRPLRDSEIRLLKILPGSWHDPVSCEIVYVSLDDKPDYVALSYAWGDSKVTHPVTVDGQEHSITMNLFHGLRRLRYMLSKVDENTNKSVEKRFGKHLSHGLRRLRYMISKADEKTNESRKKVEGLNPPITEKFIPPKLEDLYLWVDALCLNQNDEDEKSRQIPRMGDIFTFAERVYCWLGENEDNENEDIITAMAAANSCGMNYESEQPPQFSDDDHAAIYRGVNRLAKRAWFERFWVIQEVALPTKVPVILAGGSWLHMEFLISLLKYLYEIGAGKKAFLEMSHSSWRRLVSFWNLRFWHQDRERDAEVFSQTPLRTAAKMSALLSRGDLGILKATLQHDHIYGLLGLIRATELPYQLMPRYDDPFAQVCHEYAKYIVEHSNDLYILFREENRLQGVPSWVPDFRFVSTGQGLVTGNQQRLASFSPDGSKMILLGCEVCHCEYIIPRGSDNFLPSDDWLVAYIRAFNKLVFQISETHHLSPNEILKSWFLYRTLDNILGITAEEALLGYNLVLVSGMVDKQNKTLTEGLKLVFCYSIIATAEGDLGSLIREDCDAQPGDIIIASRAAPVPILLRPTNQDGEYKWVGGCDFEAFQYGERLFENRVFKEFVIV